MQRVYFAFVLLLFSLNGSAQGIVFETGTFAEVLKKAQREKKMVFVDFYTDWCGPCKKMTAEVFSRDNVGAYFNATFISYKINAEKGEGPEIARKYRVDAYPTMFFLHPDGSPVHRIVGSKSENAFLDEVRGLENAGKYGGILKMRTDFEEGRSDEMFLKDFFNFQPERDPARAKIAERYILMAPKERLMSEVEEDIMFLGGDGGIIRWIQAWNDEVMYRMLDIFAEIKKQRDFSSGYYIDVVFPMELKGGEFIQKAIDTGDQELLEKIITFQGNFRAKTGSRVHGDGDVNIMSGRGIFFASPDFIRLDYMVTNMTDPEKFKHEVVPYMEKVMADNPINAISSSIPREGSRLAEITKGRVSLLSLHKAQREHNISMNTFTKLANGYWRMMPSDEKTKETVAKWVKYTTAINPYHVKGVTNTIPLLLKVGHREDAIDILQDVLDKFGKISHDTSEMTKGIEGMIRDIKNDKI